jgi:outer membrane protein
MESSPPFTALPKTARRIETAFVTVIPSSIFPMINSIRHAERSLSRVAVLTLAALLACLFVPSPLFSRELTWNEAWEIARQQNPTLQSARMDLVTAREQVNEARAGALPQVSLSGVYTRNIELPVFVFDIGGETQHIKVGLENSYVGMAQVQQPIWVAGKVGVALKAAKSYMGQTEATLEQTRQSVYVALAQTFYGTILARELVNTAETALERATQHRDRARQMYEQGVVSEYDKIRAEVQVANLEPPLLEARKQFALSLAGLRRLLNLPPGDTLIITDSLGIQDTTIAPVDVEQALQRRAELQALHYVRGVQRQLLSLARRDLYLPAIYASANWQTQKQSEELNFDSHDWYRSAAAMLQVSLPLFDGFRTPSRVKEYRAALHRLDYAEADLRAAIRIDVEDSHRELERALRTVTVQERNVQQAQRGYDIAKVRYESGVGTQLELLDSEFQLDQARAAHLKALYDAKIARIQLRRALGQTLD